MQSQILSGCPSVTDSEVKNFFIDKNLSFFKSLERTRKAPFKIRRALFNRA